MHNTLIDLFTHIASIDSPSGEEQAVGVFIMDFLRSCGLSPVKDEYGMIYCRVGSGDDPLLFCAHMDTVEPGRGIEVIERDGWLQSQGDTIMGGDNKIALAAILYTIRDCIHRNIDINIELLFTVREETDGGIQQFDTRTLHASVGYVFDFPAGEGDLGAVAVSAPTIYDVAIELEGRSAHAGCPDDAHNVLEGLLRLHSVLKLGRYDSNTTFNLGIIQGGTATNTIPGHMRLVGDLRCSSHDHAREVKDTITRTIHHVLGDSGVKARIDFIPYSYAYAHDLEHDDMFSQLQVHYQKQGISLRPMASYSGSDAGFLNHKGITTYCLSDGVIGAHTTDERIRVETFYTLQKMVESIVCG